jgi:hypothetical protein
LSIILSNVVALSTSLRRTIGARQIAVAALSVGLALLLAWYLIAIWYDLAPWLRGWKRYPEGWSWRFLETVPRWDRFSTAALGVAPIAGGMIWLHRVSGYNSRVRTVLGLAVLVLGTYVLQLGTLGLKLSSPHALLVQRVLDEDFTGYFQAAKSVTSPAEFIVNWRELMQACGHCTSHPTGASAFYWPAIKLASLVPPEVAESTSAWAQEAFRLRVRNVEPASVIAAFLTGHVNLLLAALSVLPFYALGRLISGAAAGGVLVAGLVATMPGLQLMSPELDQVYVLIGGAALLVFLLGLRAARPGAQICLGLLCGLLLAFGLFLTWGLLVWVPFLACISLAFILGFHVASDGHETPPSVRIRRATIASAGALVGLAVPYLILGTLTPYDVRDVAKQGLTHYQVFEAIGRPGGAIWLFHGPLDTTQFIGLPLTLGALAVISASNGRAWLPIGHAAAQRLGQLNVYTVALVGMVAVTFLGSYMKAESGRQLLFLMPLAALAVAAGVRTGSAQIRPWHIGLLAAQTLVTLAIGARWITP